MSSSEPFSPLERFAQIERLVAKIYFGFPHLFPAQPELRDFRGMAYLGVFVNHFPETLRYRSE